MCFTISGRNAFFYSVRPCRKQCSVQLNSTEVSLPSFLACFPDVIEITHRANTFELESRMI